ncbi:uncharacterized protein LOC119723929 [Patiria miniata]|uniref:Uncharacterized protein n=1 Tax=Patiria miniata TaxID=46514 RepID=A0A913ZI82_PATMI|nr:uncharacterized protein LOC119723929 [Patiria miniata]XP_038050767.1 uncharacterized protein LOC119723929 [Patiria miniata]
MATPRTVSHALLVLALTCSLSLAAPAVDPRSATTNTNAPSRGSGSKLLYRDAVAVVDNMHEFLSTLSEFEEVKAGEGAREEEMIRYGIPARSKKENVGFQMPGWRRRRRRSTVEEDLVSAAFFGRLDDQADVMVNAIHKFLDDLHKVRQFYEGKSVYRESRNYHLGESRGLAPGDGQVQSQE